VLRAKDFPAVIMDHAGNLRDNGLPDDPREWTLEGAQKRGSKGDDAPPVRQCGACFYCHRPAPVCPACGFIYPIQSRMVEEIEGELAEVDRTLAVRQRKMEQGRAETLDDLIRVGASRGMKNPRGWAMHVMQGRASKKSQSVG
jgi:DNA repair protein RadD